MAVAGEAATFLPREHVSMANLDRDMVQQMRRLRAMSPKELSTELDQLAAAIDPS